MKQLFLILCLTCVLLPAVQAQTRVPMVTFGNEAEQIQGDDDFMEILFIKIPITQDQNHYLRLFDPDCGGANDEAFGPWDTQTRFTVFGGSGAYSTLGLHQTKPLERLIHSGTEITSKVFGESAILDNRWHTVLQLDLAQGEQIDGFAYFRLLIQGEGGNDGNVFDVTISTDNKLNRPPSGLEIFSYSPIVSIPKVWNRFAEARFIIPSAPVSISNFDLERVPIAFETPFTDPIPLTASAQGEWQENTLELAPAQIGDWGAVIITSSGAQHNNLSLHVNSATGGVVPIQLPILLQRENTPPEPRAQVQFLSGCQDVVFDASQSIDAQNDVLSYIWDFGDGQQGNGKRVLHTYAAPGDYTYTLTAIDDSGRVANRAKRSFDLTLNQPPQAMPGGNQIAAPGQTVSFDAAASSDADGQITRYVWDFGDGSKLEQGVKVSHSYDRPGLYRVKLRVEDDSNSPCNSGEAFAEVWVNAPPLAEAGTDQTVSPGQVVKFDGSQSFDSDGELALYQWDFGDGNTGKGLNTEHAYENPGTYTVTLNVGDNAQVGNSQISDTVRIKVNQHPIAKPTASVKRISVGEPVAFDGTASTDEDGYLTAYAWDFGDGATATSAQTAHPYAAPGTYTIQLQVTDDSQTSSATHAATIQVIVNDPPVAKAGEDHYLTASLLHFDASASHDRDGDLTKYHWDFGDGEEASSTTSATVEHVYRSPGDYVVTLSVTDDSGTTTQTTQDTLNVRINAKPVADAGPDRPLLIPGESVHFDARGSFDPDGEISAYQWHFGDGNSTTEAAPTHVYEHPGRYQVSLLVSDDSGHAAATAYDEASIIVNAPPQAVAGEDIRLAPGDSATFDARHSSDSDGTLTAYQWTFSDGITLEGATVKRRFESPGIVTATLRVTDDSGASNANAEDSLNIHINHAPVAKTNPNVHTCDATVAFDASASADADGDALRYIWDFGDDSAPMEGMQVEHTYAKGGTYPVLLTVDDRSGLKNARDSISMQVVINQSPLASAGAHLTGCAGEMILFDASQSQDPEGGRLKYLWDFGDGSTAEGMNPVKLYNKGGLYSVRLAVEDDSGLPACHGDSDQIAVTVAEAPLANAGEDQTVCANALVQFDGSQSRDFDGVVNNYAWNFGDGNSGGGQAPTHMYSVAGDYRVTLTITGDKVGQCSNTHTDDVLIKVIEAPQAVFEAPARAPQAAAVKFDASASTPDAHYQWDFGDGNTGEGLHVEHSYAQAGRYLAKLTVTGTNGGDCNSASSQQALVINAPPIAAIANVSTLKTHELVFFDGGESRDPDGALTGYAWDFGDGNQASGVQVTHRYQQPGTYSASLSVTDDADLPNSQTTSAREVTVNAPPQAAFDSAPIACPGAALSFDGGQSSDADGAIVKYAWDFGDGNRGEGRQIQHSYADPGDYSVILKVTDDHGETTQLRKPLRVNHAPVLPPRPLQRACPGEIRFSAADARDHDGEISAYRWYFGDEDLLEGMDIRHTLNTAGEYRVKLSVDDDANSQCSTTSIEWPLLVNHTPQAQIKLHAEQVFSGGVHDAVLFDASPSSDGDKDALSYTWDFGDGTQASGIHVWHHFKRAGQYTVKLTVSDDTGTACAQGSAELVVDVVAR
jgi:PKD repeat protein